MVLPLTLKGKASKGDFSFDYWLYYKEPMVNLFFVNTPMLWQKVLETIIISRTSTHVTFSGILK